MTRLHHPVQSRVEKVSHELKQCSPMTRVRVASFPFEYFCTSSLSTIALPTNDADAMKMDHEHAVSISP
eukprot:scaffold8702_cov108-Skeletonema_menzelii.AAC.1